MSDVTVVVQPITIDVAIASKTIIAEVIPGGSNSGYNSPTPIDIASPTTYNIPNGKLLLAIAVIPASGARNLSVGYTAGSTQILDNEEIDSNKEASFIVGRYFNTQKTLHISGFTGQLIFYIL